MRIRLSSRTDYAVLVVEDSGPGIDPAGRGFRASLCDAPAQGAQVTYSKPYETYVCPISGDTARWCTMSRMTNEYPSQGQPEGPSNPGSTSSFSGAYPKASSSTANSTNVTNPYITSGPAPVQTQEKRRSSVVPAVAAAIVTSLIAGGGAGYLAGSAHSSDGGAATTSSSASSSASSSTEKTKATSDSQNALEAPVDGSELPAPDGSVEKVAAAVLPAVVSIEVEGMRSATEGSGSVISSDGYVLTNHHVVESAANGQAQMSVTLNDGSRHSATYVASDVNTDVAVIKIDGVSNLPVLEFGDSDKLAVGQQVVAVGSPLGLSATVTSGIVSALNRPVRATQDGGQSSLMDGIQTDAAINPGNSGGPLVDMQGRLVGMNSVIASLSSGGYGESSGGSIGLGFAIPSNFAQRVARQLIDTGKATQPMLGVQVSVMGSGTDGAVIAQVESGSPAEAAGLQPGETITKLDDRLIDSADALIAATRSHDFGETVTLEVRDRENKERTVEATLSSE